MNQLFQAQIKSVLMRNRISLIHIKNQEKVKALLNAVDMRNVELLREPNHQSFHPGATGVYLKSEA